MKPRWAQQNAEGSSTHWHTWVRISFPINVLHNAGEANLSEIFIVDFSSLVCRATITSLLRSFGNLRSSISDRSSSHTTRQWYSLTLVASWASSGPADILCSTPAFACANYSLLSTDPWQSAVMHLPLRQRVLSVDPVDTIEALVRITDLLWSSAKSWAPTIKEPISPLSELFDST